MYDNFWIVFELEFRGHSEVHDRNEAAHANLFSLKKNGALQQA